MSSFGLYFLLIAATVAGVAILLFWSLRPRRRTIHGAKARDAGVPVGHANYLPQMLQALHPADVAFVAARGRHELSRRMKRERRDIVVDYLRFVRRDFDQLLRLARIIAVLSPEIAPAQEWERVRLSTWFSFNYFFLTMRLRCGFGIASQLNGFSGRVSELTVRIEAAMKELGERAALANELASSL